MKRKGQLHIVIVLFVFGRMREKKYGKWRKRQRQSKKGAEIEKRRRKLLRRQMRQELLADSDWRGWLHAKSLMLPAIRRWAVKILAVCLLAFAFVWSFGQRVRMAGDSMRPILDNKETVLVNRFIYNISVPERGDIIVFKPEGRSASHYSIRRIIGMPGETVEIIGNSIFINGEKLTEDYEVSEIPDAGLASGAVQLASDEYFVLGDNRKNSEDSRNADVGNVKRSYIYGKAWFVLSLGEHFGVLRDR